MRPFWPVALPVPPGALYIGGMVDPQRCPRCGGPFTCGARGPQPCPCTTVTLSPAQQEALRRTYTGCLCLACLRQLSAAPTEEAC
ncbi:MAG: hypothetical protein Fur0014_06430 [Rubrivivax sp.]